MGLPQPSQARLLVIEGNDALRETMLWLLAEEGYAPSGVSSLEEALAALDRRSYALVLADLSPGVSKQSCTPAHILQRRSQPAPLGLIAAQPSVLEPPQDAGFAFVVSRPIDVPLLLTDVAASLKYPLSSEQQRQAQVVECFLEAWGVRDWRSVLELCTEEIICYPTLLFPGAAGNAIQGKRDFLVVVTALRRRYRSLRIEALGMYARPHGLAVFYRGCFARHGQGWEFFNGAELFEFAGERICQIGTRLSYRQWRSLAEPSATALGVRRSS